MAAEHQECASGRSAFFGGAWTEPCPNQARHAIASPTAEPIWLCDEHFNEVNAAGLVKEPDIGEDEYQDREAERQGSGKRRWPWQRGQ